MSRIGVGVAVCFVFTCSALKILAIRRHVIKSAYSLLFVALVLGIACPQSAPAQTFKRVNVKGGATLVQVAAGGASVWARASNGKPYIFKVNKFVLANSISLAQLAVGGGNAFQADAVWGLNSAGSIYHATKSGTTWVFSQVLGVLSLIAVGPGYQDNCHPYEVWGLNPAAQIFRYNFCIQNWDQVPGTLGSLAVGGGEVWGINGSGEMYRFDFATLGFDQFSGWFGQVAVGPNGVWAISAQPRIFQFDDYLQVFHGLEGVLTQIQVGGNGVWGIGSSQQVFRYEPSTRSFVPIPGTLVSISVGGSGVWGLDSSGKAFAFSTP